MDMLIASQCGIVVGCSLLALDVIWMITEYPFSRGWRLRQRTRNLEPIKDMNHKPEYSGVYPITRIVEEKAQR